MTDTVLSMLRFLLYAFLLSLSWHLNAASLTGKVVKVADGDTITILESSNTQHRVRLQGIDAPERKKNGHDIFWVLDGALSGLMWRYLP